MQNHRWILSYGACPQALNVFGSYLTKAEAEAHRNEVPKCLQIYITLSHDCGIGPMDAGRVSFIPGSNALQFRALPYPATVAPDGLTLVRRSI